MMAFLAFQMPAIPIIHASRHPTIETMTEQSSNTGPWTDSNTCISGDLAVFLLMQFVSVI